MPISYSWLQDGEYTAAQDRALTYAMCDGKARVLGHHVNGTEVEDLKVTAGPPWSVQVAPGACIVRHNTASRIEALLIDVTEPETWELDPPPAGQQANIVVGFGPLVGPAATATYTVGELSRNVGAPGLGTWLGTPAGGCPLAQVSLLGSVVTVAIDARRILPLNGVISGPSVLRSVEGAVWIVTEP